MSAPEPPPGPPWDLPLEAAPLAFVDLEMTGLDPELDRVVEVCIERVRGDQVEARIESLVRPDTRAGGNVEIHGIGADRLQSSPTFCSIANEVLALLDGAIVVAHAAQWDLSFIEAELARCGIARQFPFYLDTLTLSRRTLSRPSHSLEALAAALGIERRAAHRAGDDVRVLREVWKHIVSPLSPKTARELWHVRIGERRARPEIVEACLAAVQSGRPVQLTHRPAGKPQRRITAVLTSVRTDLDPPRAMGYALPDRGRFEIRTDRILSVEATTP